MNDSSSSGTRPFWLKLWFWIFMLVLIVTTTTSFGAIIALFAPVEPEFLQLLKFYTSDALWRKRLPYRISRPINIVVMGIDQVPEVAPDSPDVFEGRSDTLLLVNANPYNNTLNLLSIPRDTQVLIPKVGFAKINEANVYGGPELVESVLEKTLGNIDIHRYVRISNEAFRELVEQLGGVEVFVTQPMSYIDKTQGLTIDLKAGWQTLNGEQAEQFARFRDEVYGDIGRVQRQQILLQALQKRVTNLGVLPRLPHIIRVMQKYVDTNLSFAEILALVNFGLDLEPEDMRMVMLPGRPSSNDESWSSYWIIDQEGRDRVIEQYFDDKVALNPIEVYGISPVESKIAIQNASSDSQASNKIAQYLREKGFSNVYVVADWPEQEPLTQVIVQTGYLESAEVVKNALGFGNIEAASIGEIGSDFTIRLGEDAVNKINQLEGSSALSR